MLVNEKQRKFLQLRIVEGKSFQTIEKEIGVPVETLKEWSLNLTEEMASVRTEEIDNLLEENEMRPLWQLKNLAQIHSRLKTELQSRDFSGLPTDKLYLMMVDVERRFANLMREITGAWEDDYDELDDFDFWDETDDDEYL